MTRSLALLLLLSAAAFGCKKTEAVKEAADKAREGDTAATRAAAGLQRDVQKADAAAAAASAAIQQTSQSVDDALKESGQ